MNYPATITTPISDVQGEADQRNIPIDRVGIKDISHPVVIVDRTGREQHTVARFNMYVGLSAAHKGTHMSRFVEILNRHEYEITVDSFRLMSREVTDVLEAENGQIEMSFPFFVEKTAPVSGAKGLLDYRVTYIAEMNGTDEARMQIKVVIPITTLCPCAKKISDYGAHNQRSEVTLRAFLEDNIWVEELIDIVEKAASCELYSLLKREDEKYVTEHAYDNPRFVEDIVRDIALELNGHDRISGYIIESENFESIHNHSAYARICKNPLPARGGHTVFESNTD